jgi:glycosyltransferase involved in cell wall biosynthesis
MLQSGKFDIAVKDIDFVDLKHVTAMKAPTRIPSAATLAANTQNLSKALVIGNFPPRQCGLATFTRDVYTALSTAQPEARIDVMAMNDVAEGYAYPPEVRYQLEQSDRAAYRRRGHELASEAYDAVYVQHEFGIFGGPSGIYLLDVLAPLTCPIITTFHTLLEAPTADQRKVMEALIARSSGLITMSHKGAEILHNTYGVPFERISVIPHGAPTRPLTDTEAFKARLKVAGCKTLTTFGLLSPNKGIETVIRALPEVREACEDVVYLVVGATHPHLLRHEGEAYRQSLIDLAARLGVENNVMFINRFIDDEALIDILQASDVYVTPYLTEAQITSGTLAYALALGRPVISTPYWHAVEALADGVGIICPFHDSAAFAGAIVGLLSDDARRQALSRRAYDAALPSRWPSVAEAYLKLSQTQIIRHHSEGMPSDAVIRPLAAFESVERMTDDTGMFQHGKYRVADRNHGYCTDDNCRALSFVARRYGTAGTSRRMLKQAYVYAAFVNHAWNADTGRFRNFMSYERQWLDDGGSDDCCARTLESLADVAASTLPEDLRLWATELIQRILPHLSEWPSTRAHAVLIRALSRMIGHVASVNELETRIAAHGEVLMAHYSQNATPLNQWIEPALSYDNARLSEGLLWASEIAYRPDWLKAGLESLRWLMVKQTCETDGHFRPVPTAQFCDQPGMPERFDQQPLEALATIEACLKAHALTHDPDWQDEARKALRWFEGANDHGLVLVTREGGCHDGLTVEGVNHNQGAESILGYQLSLLAMAGH